MRPRRVRLLLSHRCQHVRRPRRSSGGRGEEDAKLAEGDAAYNGDDFARAESAYREAAHLSPRDAAPLVGLARVSIARTNVWTDYNSAPKNPAVVRVEQDLRRAVRLDPRFGPSYIELGRALLILGRANDAVPVLKKATDLAPKDAEAASALGVALLATGHGDEAVPWLVKASELDPDNAARETNLGTALLVAGRTADAIRAFEAAVRLAPADPRAVGNLGTALLADGQIDKAIVALSRAIELDQKRATLRSNLGYALQLKHDLKGAIAAYNDAIHLDDKLGSAFINLATALAASGQFAEARGALERARLLDPGDPRVAANLEELKTMEQLRANRKNDGGRGD